MRLSCSIQKKIFEAGAGFLLNKFKVKSRRDILFFEDISAQYVSRCETCGYGQKIRYASQEWGKLTIRSLVPPLTRLPFKILYALIRGAWANARVLDELFVTKEDNILKIETTGESITRLIGKNGFMPGFYAGVFGGIFGTKLQCISADQTKKHAEYEFKITDKPILMEGKPRDIYIKLNFSPKIKGFSLEDALKENMLQLKEDNRAYFRNRPMSIAENTIFHLFGKEALLLKELPDIVYRFFSDIVEKDVTQERQLILLKSLLQVTGWGTVRIAKKDKKIVTEIFNPPYGLQLEKDNWNFLAHTILGYLWLLDKNLRLLNTEEFYKKIRITYG